MPVALLLMIVLPLLRRSASVTPSNDRDRGDREGRRLPQDEILRVAILQTAPVLGDVTANLAELDALLASVADTDLAVTPELATHGYFVGELPSLDPIPADDPRLTELARHGPAVVVGIVEAWRHHRHNAAAVLDASADDTLVGVQRKLYLPNYGRWEERKHFRPGNRQHSFTVRGARIAPLVCYDVWQTPMPWLAAHAGAEVLVVLADSVHSTSTIPVQDTWDLILRHAAVTLQSYVIFVNRTGDEAGERFWGGSRVIGPDGACLDRLGEEPGTLTVDLDLAELRRIRARWPMLIDTRFDLVAREAARLDADEHDH